MSVEKLIKGKKRKSLFHYTDARNLNGILHHNALIPPSNLREELPVGRRQNHIVTKYGETTYVANDQLKIDSGMLDSSTTETEFFKYLDEHVFLWPTFKDCQKMYNSYKRKDSRKVPAILQFNARRLLENTEDIKVCKYNSGSNPQNPYNCSYKKSSEIFLPLDALGSSERTYHPNSGGEVREILILGKVTGIGEYMEKIYCDNQERLPIEWREYFEDISNLF